MDYRYFISFNESGEAIASCMVPFYQAEAFLSANGTDRIHLEVDVALYWQITKDLKPWRLVNGIPVNVQPTLF